MTGRASPCPRARRSCARRWRSGTEIPKLCATDSIKAFGSCRLCVIEVEGRNGTPASCTTPVAPGISVKTQTPRLAAIRRGVMELYISDHPLDCLTCAANGDCELQDMAGAVGLRDVRYGYDGANHVFARNNGEVNFDWKPKDESNPYFTFDPSKCIVCNRCVRACEEVQGTFALTISGRGFESRVSAGMDEAFMESECVSCGACVQACPTATLIEKSVIAVGQPEHSEVTTCAYCGVGCTFKAEMRGEEVVRMVPWKDGKANHGHSCIKGRFAYGYAHHGDRILNPMIRESIDRALARRLVGRGDRPSPPTGFKEIQAKYGKDSVGVHHLVALHQRGELSGSEARPRWLRQQQHRHLRARLPFADRLRPDTRPSALRPARRISTRSTKPTSFSSSAPIRPTRIRCSARA